jgi:threonine dehydratase
VIFYPTGGGTGLIGMWKGFDELEKTGLIGPKRPRMIAVQAAGCAPMVRAWEQGDEFAERWEGAATMATGIRVPKAVGDFLILRAVRESGGAAIAVEEEAIMEAVAARLDGMLLPGGGAVPPHGATRGPQAGWGRRTGLVQLRQWQQISARRPFAPDASRRHGGNQPLDANPGDRLRFHGSSEDRTT